MLWISSWLPFANRPPALLWGRCLPNKATLLLHPTSFSRRRPFFINLTHLHSTVVVHASLPNITPVATKVHVVVRSWAVVAWVRDNRELVDCVTLWNNTKSALRWWQWLQRWQRNASECVVWILGWVYFDVKTCDIVGGERGDEEWGLNWGHPFPRVWG